MPHFNGRPNIFVTQCVGALGEDITEMTDMPLEETLDLDEFLSLYTGGGKALVGELAESMGYDSIDQMRDDWHVSYHASFYRGEPCLYIVHSAIEHVYMTQASATKVAEYGSGEDRQCVIEALTDELDEYEPLDDARTEAQAIGALADFYREHKEEMDANNILLSSLCLWAHPYSEAFAKADSALVLGHDERMDSEMSP